MGRFAWDGGVSQEERCSVLQLGWIQESGFSHSLVGDNCQGPAPVDPGNTKLGTVSASLEKYIFNYRYRERLEMDSVVGKLVEKKRLNIQPEKREARKKRHGGISLFGN